DRRLRAPDPAEPGGGARARAGRGRRVRRRARRRPRPCERDRRARAPPHPLEQVPARRRALPGQRQGRGLDAARVRADAARRAAARLLAGRMSERGRERSFNLFGGELERRELAERPGYEWRSAKLGERLGGKLIGMSVYELEPGQSTFPFHYHLLREEWVIVVSGRPTLRSADGDQVLETGDVAVFPAGEAGAHRLTNDGSEPARIAML